VVGGQINLLHGNKSKVNWISVKWNSYFSSWILVSGKSLGIGRRKLILLSTLSTGMYLYKYIFANLRPQRKSKMKSKPHKLVPPFFYRHPNHASVKVLKIFLIFDKVVQLFSYSVTTVTWKSGSENSFFHVELWFWLFALWVDLWF